MIPWRVYITNGDGSWIKIENTYTPDHSWRGNAFRVSDYVSPTDQVQLKFIASDSTMTNFDLSGQSLVEAGVDDLFIWDLAPVGLDEISPDKALSIYPNPADEKLVMQILSSVSKAATVQIVNALGEIVFNEPIDTDQKQFILPVKNLEDGFYALNFITDRGTVRKKFLVQH